jgi:hypothetical protein
LTGVTAVALGNAFSLALVDGGPNGTIVGWGRDLPAVPTGLNGVTEIAAGFSHALALKADGTVVAWGNNSFGQTNVPAGLSGVVEISAAGNHNLALKSDGTVVAWGSNLYGESFVPGGTCTELYESHATCSGLTSVTAIAAGAYHSVALQGFTATDTTPPTVVGVADRAPDAPNGWYSAPVAIEWQATDDSGTALAPYDVVAAIEGTTTYDSRPFCDPSNNCAVGHMQLSIDTTPPTIAITSPLVGATYTVGQSVNVAYACSDPGGSGMDFCQVTTPIDTSTAGTRTFTVDARDVAGNLASSSVTYSVLAKPDAPTDVSATPGDGQATVVWTPPISNGGSPIRHYVVTPFSNGTAGTSVAVGPSETSAVVTGLTNGTSYTFAVVAQNDVGDSDAGTTPAAVTPFGKPGTVAGLAVTYGDGTVTLNWAAPSTNGSTISKYLVKASRPGAPDVTQEVAGGTLSSTFASLDHCLSYSLTVSAVNAAGSGGASNALTNVVPASATTVQVGEAPGGTNVNFQPNELRTASEQCTRVTWKFKSTNVKKHTVTEQSAGTAGLGAGSTAMFDSGPVAAGGEFTYLVTGAGFYQYRSLLDGTSPSLLGSISMPARVSPSVGLRGTPFAIQWAPAPMPGYSFSVRYLFKKDTDSTWGTQWTTWKTGLTGTSATFTPAASSRAGTYMFSVRMRNDATSKQGGWSYVLSPTTTASGVWVLKAN